VGRTGTVVAGGNVHLLPAAVSHGNLNVKIEQEVRVKVEKDVEDLLEDNPDLF